MQNYNFSIYLERDASCCSLPLTICSTTQRHLRKRTTGVNAPCACKELILSEQEIYTNLAGLSISKNSDMFSLKLWKKFSIHSWSWILQNFIHCTGHNGSTLTLSIATTLRKTRTTKAEQKTSQLPATGISSQGYGSLQRAVTYVFNFRFYSTSE